MTNNEREELIKKAYQLLYQIDAQPTKKSQVFKALMAEMEQIKKLLGVKRLKNLPDFNKRNIRTGELIA